MYYVLLWHNRRLDRKKKLIQEIFLSRITIKKLTFYPQIIFCSLVQECLDGEGGSGCSEMDHIRSLSTSDCVSLLMSVSLFSFAKAQIRQLPDHIGT